MPCPFNPGHTVKQRLLPLHVKTCPDRPEARSNEVRVDLFVTLSKDTSKLLSTCGAQGQGWYQPLCNAGLPATEQPAQISTADVLGFLDRLQAAYEQASALLLLMALWSLCPSLKLLPCRSALARSPQRC